MKTLKAIILVLTSLFFITACAHTGQTSIERIKARGELVLGTAGSMPPLNMTTKDGEVIGLEVDLAQLMADAMEVDLRLETMPFAELLPALQSGKVDMVMSGMTITPGRNLKVAFVGPYMTSGKAFLTKRKTIAEAKEASEVNSPDTILAALEGSTSQYFVEQAISKAQLITTKDYDEAVKMVIEDKVHALVADFPICAISVIRYPEEGLLMVPAPLTYEPIGIALSPGDVHLINWVENFFRALQGSGMVDRLNERWLQDGAWLKRLP